jgi:hypothetical protein
MLRRVSLGGSCMQSSHSIEDPCGSPSIVAWKEACRDGALDSAGACCSVSWIFHVKRVLSPAPLLIRVSATSSRIFLPRRGSRLQSWGASILTWFESEMRKGHGLMYDDMLRTWTVRDQLVCA